MIIELIFQVFTTIPLESFYEELVNEYTTYQNCQKDLKYYQDYHSIERREMFICREKK
jgi:hypothetical protein